MGTCNNLPTVALCTDADRVDYADFRNAISERRHGSLVDSASIRPNVDEVQWQVRHHRLALHHRQNAIIDDERLGSFATTPRTPFPKDQLCLLVRTETATFFDQSIACVEDRAPRIEAGTLHQ